MDESRHLQRNPSNAPSGMRTQWLLQNVDIQDAPVCQQIEVNSAVTTASKCNFPNRRKRSVVYVGTAVVTHVHSIKTHLLKQVRSTMILKTDWRSQDTNMQLVHANHQYAQATGRISTERGALKFVADLLYRNKHCVRSAHTAHSRAIHIRTRYARS